jgi:SAM-dependent methyltransferase
MKDLARRALRGANRRYVQPLVRAELHRRYDADLGGLTYLDDLGVAASGRIFYQASPWLPTMLAFRRLGLGPDDVVADLGAGKGLAVLLAAEFPVRRVVGVELTELLATTARVNVAQNRSRLRAAEVEILTSDVLDWPVPDDLSVVYLHNPFIGEIFREVMERLLRHGDRRPSLRIVYNYPWEHNWLMSTGRFRVVDVTSALWPPPLAWWTRGEVIVTYALEGTEAPAGPRRHAARAALEHWGTANDTLFWLHRPGRPTVWSR